MENESIEIKNILNEDGSEFDPPINPLLEKWKEKYNTKNGEPCSSVLGYRSNGTPIMNYSCVLCHEKNCYVSDGFIVPEEDKDIYEKYLKDNKEYMKLHNPLLSKLLEENKTECCRHLS